MSNGALPSIVVVPDDGGVVDSGKTSTRSKSQQDLSRFRSLEQLCNGVVTKPTPKRAASCDEHLIVMEEFSPLRTSLSSVSEVGGNGDHATSWGLSLFDFTSKRRGSPKDDKKLARSVRRYYKKQDELISAFEGIHLDDTQQQSVDVARDNAKQLRRQASILAKVSFFVNLMLLGGKLVAAVLSGSLSVITSVIDSAVDLASGVLMWWSNCAMKRRDPYLYPQGRTKLEPVAIVVLSVIMSLASIQMIRQSIEKIVVYANYDLQDPELHNTSVVLCLSIDDMQDYAQSGGDQGPIFELESIIICVLTIVIKLVLFLVCRRVNNPGCQALAHDHRNDVISNTGAIACGIIGYQLWKYADPIGAIVICIYILVSWFHMGLEQIKMLTGHTARPDFLKKLTWIAVNHHEKVTYVDTVRAFHFGSNFLVEVDIVLPEEMSLRESHDIGESLQHRLERLEEVERAFVHIDYEVDHNPNSEHKIV